MALMAADFKLPPTQKELEELFDAHAPELEDYLTRSKENPAPLEVEHFSEGGNASRLIRLRGKDMRFSHTHKKWFLWDGSRWCIDTSGQVMRLANDLIKDLYHMVAEADERDRSAFAKFARACDSKKHLKNVLDLAACRLPIAITAEALDANSWLAVAGDVTIDLKTLKVRAPARDDLITKTLGTKFDPNATCPRWTAYLMEVFERNERLIKYIQRAVGYSLTGSMEEQVFFLLYGCGANGKSLFLRVLQALLGDYAKAASFSTFLAQRNGKVRNDLASLAGARVICAGEAEEGSKFSMATIKPWVGGDTITCRFLFGEDFSFKPEAKIWLAANTKPVISERTYAAWRRVHLIPFLFIIPKEKQDPKLSDKLLEELPGILNWALQGLKEYLDIGLVPPEEVIAATDEYRRENDSLQSFIGECCRVDKLAVCRNLELYEAYQSFCVDSGHVPFSQTKFSTELKGSPGISQTRDNQGYIWHGINLVQGCVGFDQYAVQECRQNGVSSSCQPRVENFPQMPTHPTHSTLDTENQAKPYIQPNEASNMSLNKVLENVDKIKLAEESRKHELMERFTRAGDHQIIYILEGIEHFIGIDGKVYGPYGRDDVVDLPTIHARNFITKGFARAVVPGLQIRAGAEISGATMLEVANG
jgi:P4 family phage/plasmid primase-like protien